MTNLYLKSMFKVDILFIPLDISNIPIIMALTNSDIEILDNINVGISENITVYENIYAKVFKVPPILVYNSSNGEYILWKLFEFIFVCCIILLLYDGLKNNPYYYSRQKMRYSKYYSNINTFKYTKTYSTNYVRHICITCKRNEFSSSLTIYSTVLVKL